MRSVENVVNNLNSEFEYFIITRNHDLGDKNSYQDIVTNQWQKIVVMDHVTIDKLLPLIDIMSKRLKETPVVYTSDPINH